MGMADVSSKQITVRKAKARAEVSLPDFVLEKIRNGDVPKGDVFTVSRICGIMAAKETHRLLPLCHPIPVDSAEVSVKLLPGGVEIITAVIVQAKTGCEMEALTAASLAALNVYDMCKVFTKDIVIKEIKLLEKSGGKSGDYKRK
ncbi:MAG: cyclic pyranopterin monophosphate synthase MoaC [Spirochaetales bacterium]|nr:cyclic pyranopterin monophosphate synthase MoaC [Spirochaetales bacterium]